MRKASRVVVLLLLGVVSTAVMGVVTALVAAVSLAATTALIVPGTGTPDANVVEDYMPNFWDRYIAGTDADLPAECTDGTDCTLTGINYPASFFPLVIFPGWCEPGRCETWNDSVGEGVTNLNSALIDQLVNSDDDIVLAGYSQGGAVVSNELRNLANLDPALKERLKVFLIGNAYNPDGGLFTRLGFLPTIPFIDVTFGPAMPTDTGIPITSVGFEYDPVMYAPRFWGNGLAMLNAFAAFDNVHGFYLTPNGNGPTDAIAYGYTEEELAEILATGCPGAYCRLGSDGNKYYMIPAKSLPLMNLITSIVPAPLRPFVRPIIELVSPAAEVLINLGYDWSGDPDQTRYASFLPFKLNTNWLQVGADLAEAVVEGIENAFGGGSTTMIAPSGDEVTFAATSQRSAVAESTAEADVAVVSDEAPADEAPVDEVPVDETEGVSDEDDSTEDDATEDEIVTEDDTVTETEGTKDDETTSTTEDDDTVTAGDEETTTAGGAEDDSSDTDSDTDSGADADKAAA